MNTTKLHLASHKRVHVREFPPQIVFERVSERVRRRCVPDKRGRGPVLNRRALIAAFVRVRAKQRMRVRAAEHSLGGRRAMQKERITGCRGICKENVRVVGVRVDSRLAATVPNDERCPDARDARYTVNQLGVVQAGITPI